MTRAPAPVNVANGLPALNWRHQRNRIPWFNHIIALDPLGSRGDQKMLVPGLQAWCFVERDSGANPRRSFLPPLQSSLAPPNRGAGQSIGFESALSGFQNADERQVSISLLIVETVTDDELVLDIESDVIRLNRQASLFHFSQKHTAFQA